MRAIPKIPRKPVALVAAILGGLAAGLGVYAFDYGEGLSYFSKDPRACANCHVMHDEYDSWQKGGHHQAATCVDCHLPHDFIPKYIAKADNGFWHSKGFTFMDFHDPIQIKRRNPPERLPALPRGLCPRTRRRQPLARRGNPSMRALPPRRRPRRAILTTNLNPP